MMTRWWKVLILLQAAGLRARGGGRTSGGSSRDYDPGDTRSDPFSRAYDPYDTSYDPYGHDRSYSYGREYDTYHYSGTYGSTGWEYWSSDYGFYLGTLWVPQYIITLLVILFFFTCCCCCCCRSKYRSGVPERSRVVRPPNDEGITPCYLCLVDVPNSAWDSGEHRRQCAIHNQGELSSYSQPYDAYCPHCSARLRLWPPKGHPFYCDECPYEGDVLKTSTGQNRLNCFLCDFDCCVDCSNAGRFRIVGDVEQNNFPYRQPLMYPPLIPEGHPQQIYP